VRALGCSAASDPALSSGRGFSSDGINTPSPRPRDTSWAVSAGRIPASASLSLGAGVNEDVVATEGRTLVSIGATYTFATLAQVEAPVNSLL